MAIGNGNKAFQMDNEMCVCAFLLGVGGQKHCVKGGRWVLKLRRGADQKSYDLPLGDKVWGRMKQ